MIPDEAIVNKIFMARGQKVMLDRDLAELYGIETKRLKEAVRRNMERFPEDFMFEMSVPEFELWRKDNALAQNDRMGLRYAPFCFTEQGVTMLSCVLKTKTAIEVNIRIIRIFTRIREMIFHNQEIMLKLEKIENRFLKNQEQIDQHDEEITAIFDCLKQLVSTENPERNPIGFKN